MAWAIAAPAAEMSALADSKPSISLSVEVGPPTAPVAVSGTGFAPSEAVDLYFDTGPVALTVADDTGAFSNLEFTVPPAAGPGEHTVIAVGRQTGIGAEQPFLVRTDWPQFHDSSDRAGANSYENTLNPSNVSRLAQTWSVRLGESGIFFRRASPIVAGGSVFATSEGGALFAVDEASGGVRWVARTHAELGSSPAYTDGLVLLGAGTMDAFDGATGDLVWQRYLLGDSPGNVATEVGEPAVADDAVYFATQTHAFHPNGPRLNVYALDAGSGHVRWRHGFRGSGEIVDPVAVSQGIVYVTVDHLPLGGPFSTDVYALRASTGGELWHRSAPHEGYPVVGDGVLVVAGAQGTVVAYSPRNGVRLWKHNPLNTVITWTPAIDQGVLYLGSVAFDVFTGRTLWRVVLGHSGAVSGTSPAVANGVVFAGGLFAQPTVYAFEATTGHRLWRTQTGSSFTGSPAVANGCLYLIGDDNVLRADCLS
jgi:outer membrane protein assembly factor BamB